MKRSKGFTLIELMVVVIILGILAVLVAPRIPALVRKAKEGATKGGLATLRSTMNIYYSNCDGVYPIDTTANDTETTGVKDLLVPKYIKKIPKCDTVTHTPSDILTGDTESSPVGDADLGQWQYGCSNTVEEYYGSVWVECTHTDSSGTQWSTY